jgi:hypothetical protein
MTLSFVSARQNVTMTSGAVLRGEPLVRRGRQGRAGIAWGDAEESTDWPDFKEA